MMRINHSTAATVLLSGCLAAGLAGCGRSSVAISADPVAMVEAPAKEQAPGDPAAAPKRGEGGDAGKDGFRFPDDRGGRLLAELLPPADKTHRSAVEDPAAPKHLLGVPAVEQPSLPLPPSAVLQPRLPLEKAPHSVRPGPLPEDLPLTSHRVDPVVPLVQSLPAGERVRLPSPDVNQPVPLPTLARPVADRAPLDDPTTEATLAAALAAQPPDRTNPAPFVRLTLPDPFENHRTVRLGSLPAEDADPVSPASRPPVKP